MARKITIFIFAFLSFFVGLNVKATVLNDVIFSQFSSSAKDTNTPLGIKFIPTKNNFVGVFVAMNNTWNGSTAPTSTIEVYLCKGNIQVNNFNSSYKCTGANNQFIASTTYSITSITNQYISRNVIFPETKVIDQGANYYLSFKNTGINTNIGVSSTNQPYGLVSNQVYDQYNSLAAYSATLYDNNFSYVAFDEPSEGARFSSGADIGLVLSYLNPIDTYSHIELDLLNKELKQTTKFYYSLTQGTSTQYVVPVLSGLVDDNYRATAFMYNVYNGVTSSPANLNFVVGSTTVYFAGDYADPIEENICKDIDVSTFYGGVKCALREVVLWAFKPTKDSTIYFNNSYTELKKSFPFSAFYSLTDTINQGIASTTLSNSSTIDIVLVKQQAGHAKFYSTPIISSSTMAKTIGQNNTNLIRNSLGWLMWFAVAWFIFLQFKKI